MSLAYSAPPSGLGIGSRVRVRRRYNIERLLAEWREHDPVAARGPVSETNETSDR